MPTFIDDDKLPLDVGRKEYAETRHALCCLECGFEASFDPTVEGSIGSPLLALVNHECKEDGD
jgi:hypothetical protein